MGLFEKKDDGQQRKAIDERFAQLQERIASREQAARAEAGTAGERMGPQNHAAQSPAPDPPPPDGGPAGKRKRPADDGGDRNSLFDGMDIPGADRDGGSVIRENEIVARTRDAVKVTFGDRILSEQDDPGFRDEVRRAIDEKLRDETDGITRESRPRVTQRIFDLIFGLGPLQPLFDGGYTEIEVQAYDRVFVEKDGKMLQTEARFGSEDELRELIKRMAGRIGRTIDMKNTTVDGQLQDGSRFNAVFPPTSPKGANLTIRRFKDHRVSPGEYVGYGSADDRMLDFLRICVRAGVNTIVSGGTGSGKTTLLNLLSSFVPDDEAVITIEDSLELKLECVNWRIRETKVLDAQGCVKNALRERPDRIIVGEIRDGTMADFLDIANSGHEGCLTTVHANSPRGLTTRVISLFKKANIPGYGADDIKRLYADSVMMIVQIKRYPDRVRRISHISHIAGFGADGAEALGIAPGDVHYRPDDIYIEDIFRWEPEGGYGDDGRLRGSYRPTGYVPRAIVEKAMNLGVRIPDDIFREREGEK